MIGSPERSEAAEYYFTYIDKAATTDIVGHLRAQAAEALTLLQSISEEKSLHRYGPDKWTIREVLSHINDAERVFAFRAFWFARGAQAPMPGFEQNEFIAKADADSRSWASHISEFQALRAGTLALFESLPADAWPRSGVASNMPVTVRALAFITAGHVTHHIRIIQERYL